MDRRDFLTTGTLSLCGMLCATLPAPMLQELFYYAWSWDKWRAITGAKAQKYISDQVGKHALVDLLRFRGHRIVTPEEWLLKRQEIKDLLLQVLGDFPRVTPLLNPRTVEEKEFNAYIRRKVVYTVEPGDDVPAYVFFPKDGAKNHPAVLCAHQTNPYGKREAAGIDGNPAMAFAPQLAERGYVTIAPDEICFGERHNPLLGHYGEAIAFYERHKQWSIAGKMIWDKSRAIDYLWTLDEVDPERIGAIGHSHGAYGSLMAAAFDSRIKAVVSSCGFVPFRTDGNTFRWSHATPLLPKLGFFLGGKEMTLQTFQRFRLQEVDQVPFDWHHILALIVPRALFLSVGLEDEIFPGGESVRREVVPRIEPIYDLYDSRARFESYFFDGKHTFPGEARERSYTFLDRWLRTETK